MMQVLSKSLRAAKLFVYKKLNRSWPIALSFNGRKLWGWKPLSLWYPHEQETTKFFEQYIKPGMTVADVGANVGWFTVIFSDLVGPKGKVYAYEPDTLSFKRLTKAIDHLARVRGYRNVQPFQAAVSEKEGFADLYGAPGSGRNSITQKDYGSFMERVKTLVLPDDVDIAKIDVEGAEVEVLRGAKPKAATIEYSFTIFKETGLSGKAYLDEVRELGYEISVINEDGSTTRLASELPLGVGHINLFIKKV